MKVQPRAVASDVLFVMGAVLCTYGVWRIYEPAALVFGGVVLCVIGYGLAKARVPNRGG